MVGYIKIRRTKMAKKPKLDVNRISDDELVEMFEPVYEKQIASINEIGSYEVNCKRDTSSGDVVLEVMVVGMAGSPTLDDYKEGKLENPGSVVLSVEGRGSIKFNLVPKEMIALNTNDYTAVYKAVK